LTAALVVAELVTFSVSIDPKLLPISKVSVGAVPVATPVTNPADPNDVFWLRLKVPIELSTMLKALPAFKVSVAPAVPVPVVPAATELEPGTAAKVAPLATPIAVFARLPPATNRSVPLLIVVLPVYVLAPE
jgi:hypothetical protein